MRNYTTQMDAARKGILTPEIETVAKKEHMPVEKLMQLVAEGKVAICANKKHTCLDPEGVGSMLRTKINVNLGVSRDCKDYDIEMQKVMSAVNLGAEAIMDLAKEITPGFKTIGALYSAGEDNSDSVIKGLKEYADKNGYEVVESTVTNTSEVQQAAQYLADKADVVYSPIDNTIASAMAVASETFNNSKVPFYVSADSMVKDGGLATYGIDYTVLGKETAKMVAQVLGGADVSTMAVVKMSDMNIYVNTKTADAIGVQIPQDILDKATVLE